MAKDICSFGIFYNIANQPGMSELHFRTIDEGPGEPDDLCKAIITGWIDDLEDLFLACIPESVAVAGYKCRRVNNGGGPTVIKPRAEIGTRSGQISTTGVGPCIIWGYQKSGGGWAAGRTFLPGVSESDIVNNALDDSLLTALDSFIIPMLARPTIDISGTGGVEFVIYSKVHASSSGVETGGVSGKPGVQNRRMKPIF